MYQLIFKLFLTNVKLSTNDMSMPNCRFMKCPKLHSFSSDVLDVVADKSGRTGLMWAAAEGKAEVIQVMCRHGADTNMTVS